MLLCVRFCPYVQVSKADCGLCCWVRAMEQYARAAKAEKAQEDRARFADYASFKSCEDMVAPGTPPANSTANQVSDCFASTGTAAVVASLQLPPPLCGMHAWRASVSACCLFAKHCGSSERLRRCAVWCAGSCQQPFPPVPLCYLPSRPVPAAPRGLGSPPRWHQELLQRAGPFWLSSCGTQPTPTAHSQACHCLRSQPPALQPHRTLPSPTATAPTQQPPSPAQPRAPCQAASPWRRTGPRGGA